MKQKVPAVSIVMGSKSDWEVMSAAARTLKSFRVEHAVQVVSAHRTPAMLLDFASSARKKGIQVIIAGAGGAAHLPGMVAASTTVPVIGVPILSRNSLLGLDSILSILQMPQGVPVATVALNGAENAALLAVQILAVADRNLAEKLADHKAALEAHVASQNAALRD